MALGSQELYALFLALSPARLAAAQRALTEFEGRDRLRELEGALIPLAVDATLLGADGVSALARAIANAHGVPLGDLVEALGVLERAVTALGQGDASGARVDEAALSEYAQRLKQLTLVPTPALGSSPAFAAAGYRVAAAELMGTEEPAPKTRASGTPDALAPEVWTEQRVPAAPALPRASAPPRRDSARRDPVRLEPELSAIEYWQPQLAEDMVAAFLDECAERTEGLAQRLLELEERGADPELVGEIFRDLHTLKGSSGFAGLKKLNRVAHVAEDLIGELRSGRRAPDRALVDLLLETLAALQAIVDQARADQPIDVDVADLVARLRDPDRAAPAALVVAPHADNAPEPAPAQAARSEGSAPPLARAAAPRAAATLRIDFEKVDLLLNLVGEIVLSRGQLSAGEEAYGSLLREVSLFRGRLGAALVDEARSFASTGTDGSARALAPRLEAGWQDALLEELQRIERVLAEGYADFDTNLNRLGLAVGQLRDTVMKLRMVPIERSFTKYQRTVRELSHQLGKQVRVELVGAETELDKVLVERLDDPLLHLVRNAVDHGIEMPERREQAGKPRQGLVRLCASQRGGQIVVLIEDDGGGLDAQKLKRKAIEKGLLTADEAEDLPESKAFDLIFHAGFSTAAQVSDVSGRGVGMDVVRATIDKLKGSILVRSELGVGTTIELRLPLTLAITQVLAVRVGSELVALPLDAVISAQSLSDSELEDVAGRPCFRSGEELLPVISLADALGLGDEASAAESLLKDASGGSVIVVHVGTERLGLVVQQVLARHEVVIKSLGPLLSRTRCAAGATLLGERIALVVDLGGVAAQVREPSLRGVPVPAPEKQRPPRLLGRVLVAEDSDIVRQSLVRELGAVGFEVSAAVDGRAALDLALSSSFDAICTDIMMPNLDGYQLIRALRELPAYRSVPIVVLSSKDARIDSLRGLDAGADSYLNKPADTGQLIRELERLMRLRRKG